MVTRPRCPESVCSSTGASSFQPHSLAVSTVEPEAEAYCPERRRRRGDPRAARIPVHAADAIVVGAPRFQHVAAVQVPQAQLAAEASRQQARAVDAAAGDGALAAELGALHEQVLFRQIAFQDKRYIDPTTA